ncbi:MAG: PEP-CTERM sorting domain-containing protein [Rhodocyclaceae bacterium]|nr:PEP-CTERM sorting domain-containing protein [Rhodocyclaceae bacterium]
MINRRISSACAGRTARLAASLAVFALGAAANAASYSGAGVEFNRVSFDYAGFSVPDSNYGLLSADFDTISTALGGGSFGFLNVANSGGWLVQNLPVDLSSGLNGLSVLFDLGITPTGATSINASIDFSSTPLATYSAGVQSAFALNSVTMNGSGLGGPVTALGAPPAAGGVTFNVPGFNLIWQPGHVSLEEDDEQCGPGSLARSFTYLENRYGIDIPDPNNPGTRNTANSLVGKIDDLIDRDPGQSFSYAQLMNGKLDYLGGSGLVPRILLHHHNNGDNKIGAGNYVSPGSVTSRDDSATPVLEWLLEQIRSGQDIEMVYGNRHVVEIVGGGSIFGRTWIAVQDDADQGDPGGTSFLEGGLRFTFLEDTDGDGRLNARNLAALNDGNNINLFTAESVPEPATLLLVPLAAAMAGMRRQRKQ